MKYLDQVICIFFISLCAFICLESLKLGLGKIGNPGPGFMPFLISVIVSILALSVFVKGLIGAKQNEIKYFTVSRQNLIKIIILIVALCLYTLSLNYLGYLIATFLLMFLILLLFNPFNPRQMYIYIIIAILVVNLSYLFFGKWLQVELPIGKFHIIW